MDREQRIRELERSQASSRDMATAIVDLEEERDRYEKAIRDCLEMAASRYWEWGDRAVKAIEILEQSLEPTLDRK